MTEKFKNWWSDFKKFDWWMFLALCLLALVPTIYQTVITRLITEHTNPGALDILGQMEWFDLIDETIRAFLIVPMYSILSKAKKRENFNQAGKYIQVKYLYTNCDGTESIESQSFWIRKLTDDTLELVEWRYRKRIERYHAKPIQEQ